VGGEGVVRLFNHLNVQGEVGEKQMGVEETPDGGGQGVGNVGGDGRGSGHGRSELQDIVVGLRGMGGDGAAGYRRGRR
jgi:hypothetical protein